MENIPGGQLRGGITWRLTWRLLAGVAVAVGAFVAVHRVTLLLVGTNEVAAAVIAFIAAIGLGAASLRPIVAPLVATNADLQVRYAVAVADALRDPLTGLGNHRAFHEELERQVATALRYGVSLALLVIDLDDFKTVNDRRGHAGGDRVLRQFGAVLNASLRRADRGFRVGGDEFAVLLPHTALDGARVAARRLLGQALQPRLHGEETTEMSFSAGVSALPELAVTAAELFDQADAALYTAKHAGRTEVATYAPTLSSAPAGSSGSSSAVAEVIAGLQLRAVYQPIVSLHGGEVIGVEGLIRPVPPSPFANPAELFAAAEAAGRVTALDLACIDVIVAGAKDLSSDQFLSLNLSPATMEADEFNSGALVAILARHGFPPDRVIVELTEHQQLRFPERVRGRVEACRRMGVRFAADDIGAGNAGLRLLSEIRFDVLKVDLSLVRRSASEDQSSAVLGSVVEFAELTGALVIAEGIEHSSQLSRLMTLGITAGQGYHLGRPGPLHASMTSEPSELPAAGVAAWRQSMGMPPVN